jgi:hypothetical protein
VSLRGPNPLSGSPHAATGSVPGLGVIQVKQGGKDGVLKSVIPISTVDSAAGMSTQHVCSGQNIEARTSTIYAAGVERADAHGVRVRLK